MVSGAKALEIILEQEWLGWACEHCRPIPTSRIRRFNLALTVLPKFVVRSNAWRWDQACGELNKFGEPKSDGELYPSDSAGGIRRGLMVEKGGRDSSVIRFHHRWLSLLNRSFAARGGESLHIAASRRCARRSASTDNWLQVEQAFHSHR